MLSKHLVITALIGISAATNLSAQDKPATMIGLSPSVTVEPFYAKGELDMNILPLVFQRKLRPRVDVRLLSLLNLGIRNNGNIISHFGGEAVFPIYFSDLQSRTERSQGFYLAPVVGLTRNAAENHTNLGLWIEPGYQFLFMNGMSISLGLQSGGTLFMHDERAHEWGQHFGFKFIIGKWL